MLFPHSPIQKGGQVAQLRGGTAPAGGDGEISAPGEDGQCREEMPSPEEMVMWQRMGCHPWLVHRAVLCIPLETALFEVAAGWGAKCQHLGCRRYKSLGNSTV